jgi:FtsP/CotA-like multicopper oxidase with cupredoxin domain
MSERRFRLSRRKFLAAGGIGAAGAVAGAAVRGAGRAGADPSHANPEHDHLSNAFARAHDAHAGHFGNLAVGDIDTSVFDPSAYLTEFDWGKESKLPDGRTLREYAITAVDVPIEVAPGVEFAAWAYNGKVPGPTIRAREGDQIRIHFTNAGSHPHTMHFHGFHAAGMDGVFELVKQGQTFTYDFLAEPFGLHLYHCHTPPLKRHIHKGLYGVFMIDPPQGRAPAHEMVMMMNAFDTNFDGENEVYAVNTVAHHYLRHPIKVKANELVRVYVVNVTEFDPVNSFHTHATFFNEFRTGTRMEPNAFTDTMVLAQGERSIIEFRYRDPGRYMFHAHVSEFAELGWAGMFEVEP